MVERRVRAHDDEDELPARGRRERVVAQPAAGRGGDDRLLERGDRLRGGAQVLVALAVDHEPPRRARPHALGEPLGLYHLRACGAEQRRGHLDLAAGPARPLAPADAHAAGVRPGRHRHDEGVLEPGAVQQPGQLVGRRAAQGRVDPLLEAHAVEPPQPLRPRGRRRPRPARRVARTHVDDHRARPERFGQILGPPPTIGSSPPRRRRAADPRAPVRSSASTPTQSPRHRTDCVSRAVAGARSKRPVRSCGTTSVAGSCATRVARNAPTAQDAGEHEQAAVGRPRGVLHQAPPGRGRRSRRGCRSS